MRLAIWLLVLGAVNIMCLGAFAALFPDDAGAPARAALITTPSGIVFAGPGYGADHYDLGAMMSNEMLIYYEIALAIGAIVLVVRGTRAEEETGRAELVGSGAVGRHAPLAATLLVVGTLSMAAGLALAASFAGSGLAAADALAFGMGVGFTGMGFAGVAAVTAQVARTSRGASGLAIATVFAAFGVRAVGDVQRLHGSTLSWCSPLAWPQQMRPFTDLRWWPLGLSVGVCVIATLVACALATRRDLGGAALPQVGGRTHASASLRGPMSLAWRISRGLWVAWCLGAATLTAGFGPFAGDLDDYVRDNPMVAQLLGLDPAAAATQMCDAFTAWVVMFAAVLAICFTLWAATRLRAEETEGLAEELLAAPIGRIRWLLSPWTVATLGGTAILAVAGLALGASIPRPPGEALMPTMAAHLLGALAYVPAVVASAGLAVAVWAVAPRAGGVNWALLAYGLLATMFAAPLGLPDWALRVAPLSAIPPPMANTWDLPSAAWVTAAGLALILASALAVRRRDIPR
jgi:ABC-2 type transport system permease protein